MSHSGTLVSSIVAFSSSPAVSSAVVASAEAEPSVSSLTTAFAQGRWRFFDDDDASVDDDGGDGTLTWTN